MSDTRSNGGCWTCRVRRKKCDEAHPECLTCTSLHIPCHGYGPRPTWMDRGAREREIALSLRNRVKVAVGLQRVRRSKQLGSSNELISRDLVPSDCLGDASLLNSTSKQDDLAAASLSSENFSLVQARSISSPSDTSSAQNSLSGPAQPNPAAAIVASSTTSNTLDFLLTNESWSILPVQFEEDQASLLMHFFDHVFPLQFRFYNPLVSEGGRGWLLSILTQTKALYHVALSLAAYHQQSILVCEKPSMCPASLRKLEERHIECLRLLRSHLQRLPVGVETNTCETNIEIMACIAMLIALELFRGDTNHWQMHLKAASSLSLKCARDRVNESASWHTRERAMRFFRSVITWYDILSCASTGLKPISKFNNIDEGILPPLPFEKLMGCESWLMYIIREIAMLSEWKRQMERNGSLSTRELVRRATDIETQLETGSMKSFQQANETVTHNLTTTSDCLTRDITRIFAGGAFVYLQVVISGPFPHIPEIQQGVSRTMAALDALTDKDLVRYVLWPVCIAGCMATQEDESYWRDLLSNAGRKKWSFSYPFKVLEVMEECWRLRKGRDGNVQAVDWMTAMDSLNMKVLLV